MSIKGELGLDILGILTTADHYLTVWEIRKEFEKVGRIHGYTPVRYALVNLKNGGLVDQEHDGKEWRFFINEHFRRSQRIMDFHAYISRWTYPNLEEEPFTSLSEDDMLRIEYFWAQGLSRIYSKLVEVLVDKDLYNEEEDPVESGSSGTPWYGDEKENEDKSKSI